MKLLTIFVLLVTSMATIAKTNTTVYPRITVWPNGIDVRVYNSTDKDLRCTGSISVWTRSGRFKTEYYSSTIYRGMTDYKRFSNWNHSDPYRNAHHSIRCREY